MRHPPYETPVIVAGVAVPFILPYISIGLWPILPVVLGSVAWYTIHRKDVRAYKRAVKQMHVELKEIERRSNESPAR